MKISVSLADQISTKSTEGLVEHMEMSIYGLI
jgi:hypothetical protein